MAQEQFKQIDDERFVKRDIVNFNRSSNERRKKLFATLRRSHKMMVERNGELLDFLADSRRSEKVAVWVMGICVILVIALIIIFVMK